MKLFHWHYFLSLERDFIATLDYVELDPKNRGILKNRRTYSNEFAKILLLAGSEFDVVAKLLCAKHGTKLTSSKISKYREVLTVALPGIHKIEISIFRCKLTRKPLWAWGAAEPKNPSWWMAYNNVKHERDKYFHLANQENALDALCGLQAIIFYYHGGTDGLSPFPELIGEGKFPGTLLLGGRPNLPGLT